MYYLFNDEMFWGKAEPVLYPVSILAADNKSLIRVYIGKPRDENKVSNELAEELIFGIYVDNEDYFKINHKKTYVLFHDVDTISGSEENLAWIAEVLADNKNNTSHHINANKLSELYEAIVVDPFAIVN